MPVPGKKQEAKGENTMQRFITDERTGIRYELIGDYYYPCLTVEESPPLSKYGRLRQRYLREHKRVLYFNLLTSGKLYEHLAEIDTSARGFSACPWQKSINFIKVL